MQESSNAFVPELDERICILIGSTSASVRTSIVALAMIRNLLGDQGEEPGRSQAPAVAALDGNSTGFDPGWVRRKTGRSTSSGARRSRGRGVAWVGRLIRSRKAAGDAGGFFSVDVTLEKARTEIESVGSTHRGDR
jgi:hypothetical protein